MGDLGQKLFKDVPVALELRSRRRQAIARRASVRNFGEDAWSAARDLELPGLVITILSNHQHVM
jgi:ribosomal protein S8